jgi:hypothetical protein
MIHSRVQEIIGQDRKQRTSENQTKNKWMIDPGISVFTFYTGRFPHVQFYTFPLTGRVRTKAKQLDLKFVRCFTMQIYTSDSTTG